MKLLQIDSSARRNSVSRQLTEKFVHAWKKQNPAGHVIKRDLATTTLPLITDEWTLAAHSDRYLYSHIRHKRLKELAAEFKDSRPMMTTQGFGPKKFAKIEVARRMGSE